MSNRIFYDSEFTGLTQNTTLISIGLISDNGSSFYAEFSDFDQQQIDQWIKDNVLIHCRWTAGKPQFFVRQNEQITEAYGDTVYVAKALKVWLNQFKQIEVWADCLAWDWVLFCGLFGGAFGLPKQIHYMPGDLSTLFRVKGLDPDTPREAFANMDTPDAQKHNALWDAKVSQACYQRLIQLP